MTSIWAVVDIEPNRESINLALSCIQGALGDHALQNGVTMLDQRFDVAGARVPSSGSVRKTVFLD